MAGETSSAFDLCTSCYPDRMPDERSLLDRMMDFGDYHLSGTVMNRPPRKNRDDSDQAGSGSLIGDVGGSSGSADDCGAGGDGGGDCGSGGDGGSGGD